MQMLNIEVEVFVSTFKKCLLYSILAIMMRRYKFSFVLQVSVYSSFFHKIKNINKRKYSICKIFYSFNSCFYNLIHQFSISKNCICYECSIF